MMRLGQQDIYWKDTPWDQKTCARVNAGARAIGLRPTLIALLAKERQQHPLNVLWEKARAREALETAEAAAAGAGASKSYG